MKKSKPAPRPPIQPDDAKPMTWTKHQLTDLVAFWAATHAIENHLLLFTITPKDAQFVLISRLFTIPVSLGNIHVAVQTFPTFQQARSAAHLNADQAPWRIKSLESPKSPASLKSH